MTETLKLPVLPLTDSVLLPGMVIPVRLDEPDTQAAVDAAASGDRKILVVPRLDGRYAPVGTVAVVEQVGRLPSGEPAAVVRGVGRARIGAGVTGPGAALWVEADDRRPSPAPTGRGPRAGREYKALVAVHPAAARRLAGHRRRPADRPTRPRSPTPPATRSWLDRRPEGRSCSETTDVERRLELLIGWAARAPRRAGGRREDPQGRPRGHGEAAAGVPAAPAARRDPQGARARASRRASDDYRARVEAADLPEKVREAALREVGKLERSSRPVPEAGWIRTWLDTVLEMPWNVRTEDNDRPRRRPRGARRRPRRPRRREGPIIEYLAVRNAARRRAA